MEDVINAFSQYRLLTLDRDPITRGPTVEVAHEALISQWERLHEWLAASREGVRLQRSLAQAASEWEQSNRDSSYLLSGARLAQFEAWAAETDLALTAQERAFLDASLAEHTRLVAQEQARQAHERQLERRSRTVLRILVGVLLLATLGAFGLTGIAVNQRGIAEGNFRRAESQRLAAEAKSLLLQQGSADLAALLALRSLNTEYTPQGDEALIAASLLDYPIQAFIGHTDRVKAVDYSPDGRSVLTGSGDSTVRLWDVQTGAEIQRFAGDMQDINSAVFSPDGQRVLTGSRHDHTVRLWDVASGEELKRFNEGNAGTFSLDGQQIFLFSENNENSVMIDLASGEILHTIPGLQRWRRPESTGYSPDGRLFVDVPLDNDIGFIRRVDTGEAILTFPVSDSFENFTFSSDNRYFAVVSGRGIVDLWQLETAERMHTLTVDQEVEVISLAFSPDNQLLVMGGGSANVHVWEVQTGREIRRFRGHGLPVRNVDFSLDGRRILSGSFDQRALLWDLYPAEASEQFDEENFDLYSAVLSPDGTHMVTTRDDGTVMLWDMNTNRLTNTLRAGNEAVWFSGIRPDNHLLVTASDQVRIWNAIDGSLLRELPQVDVMMTGNSTLNWLDLSSNYLVAAYSGVNEGAGSVSLWDLETGEEVRHYPTPAGAVVGMMSPDGRYVVTQTTFDRLFRVLDAVGGQELYTFQSLNNYSFGHFHAFSPDSKLFFTGGNVISAFWNLDSGEQIHEIIGHRDFVLSSYFSHDGRLLVTSSADQTVRLWDVETGHEVRRLTLPFSPLSAEFMRDDKMLVVLGDDGKIHFFDVEFQDTIQALCARLLRDFTLEEREQYAITDNVPTCSSHEVSEVG
jgi:WD40 repeat protein